MAEHGDSSQEQAGLPPGVPRATEAPRAPRLRRPPFWIISIGLIAVLASWIPLTLSGRARSSKSSEPRVHLVQDMGLQPKLTAQEHSTLFADNRGDRPHIPGTVARGKAELDDHYYRGYAMEPAGSGKFQPRFFEGFPQQVKLNDALVRRGQERYGIYCSMCHGLDGYGNGTVTARSAELNQRINAANLHDATFRGRVEGHLYNTINVGIRSMPGYGTQIPVEDRWAIVAYVRALQLSQNAPASMLPQGQRTDAR